jgi:hypothetical protein
MILPLPLLRAYHARSIILLSAYASGSVLGTSLNGGRLAVQF